MKYEIKNDSTQVVFEPMDNRHEPVHKQDEFGGETIFCSRSGECRSVPCKPNIEPRSEE